MQISTSNFYDTTGTLMQQLSQQADTINTQIATTKKFSAPSDDVVAYQRLTSLKQATADANSYTGNITLAQSLLQQTDTTLGTITTQLQSAGEIAVSANNDTLSASDRQAMATQLQGILNSVVALANTTDARGQPLFGAATGASAVTQAADGSVTFDGTGNPPSIPIADGVSVQPTESAARAFGGIPTASGGTTDVFATLQGLITALNNNDTTAIAGASASVTAASNQVAAVRGSIGVRETSVNLQQSQATDAATARETDRSALEDTDVTTAITQLQKTMTVLQATQASFTKLSSLSLFDYLK